MPCTPPVTILPGPSHREPLGGLGFSPFDRQATTMKRQNIGVAPLAQASSLCAPNWAALEADAEQQLAEEKETEFSRPPFRAPYAG
jgi:hypothetical protein